MRYLYKQDDTTYDELLQLIEEAESEWLDNKLRVKSTVMVEDSGRKNEKN